MTDIIKDKWQEILQTVKEERNMADPSYNTWLRPLQPVSEEGGVLTILYPGESFGVDYITRSYAYYLKGAILAITGKMCDIRIVSGQETAAKPAEAPAPRTVIGSKLNPRYTFDSFVVGNSNKIAHAASLAVAESPAQSWNPLFIHGGVGLGKTHLMQAIALFILKNDPSAKVLYTNCEKFINDLVDAIRNRGGFSTSDFREKYRSVDVLIIDDIQFLGKGEFVQEEVFNTFNSLYESNKQIVFASDRAPRDINNIDERITSRFLSGLTVEITPPDYETRVAILRKKEEIEGYNIDNEVISYIAAQIKSNIRELEGALKKVHAYSELTKRELTIDLAEETLKDHISHSEQAINSQKIIEVVADHFGLRTSDLTSEKRNKSLAYPRQIAMYLCCDMVSESLMTVASALGKKDHSTVIYGRDKIKKELETDESLRNTIEILKKKLSG